MGQQYCFSCGRALIDAELTAEGGGLALLCGDCRGGGDAIGSADGRWMVRRGDERPVGPLARESVNDRLARDLLGPYDQISRVNGAWQRLVEHPDFRATFIPGTPEEIELSRVKEGLNTDRAAETGRKRRRTGLLVGLGVVGIVLPAISVLTGATVLPEPLLNAVIGLWSSATGAVSDGVRSAADSEAAAAKIAAARPLPAGTAIDRLRVAWPAVEEPMVLLVAKGQADLAHGSRAGNLAAQEAFEKAVVLAPNDAEAVSWLALSYLSLLAESPDQLGNALSLADRADALAPASIPALRARAAVQLASGNAANAKETATQCAGAQTANPADPAAPAAPADPATPATPAAPAAPVDPVCAAIAALATGDADALAALSAHYPGVSPLDLARGSLAMRTGAYGEALRIGRELTRRNRDDAASLVLVSDAALAIGEWKEAETAASRAGALEDFRLQTRANGAEILLKVAHDPKASLAAYEGLIAHARWVDYAHKGRIYAAAATAAVEAGDAGRALALADLALAEDKGDPTAILAKARALSALKRPDEVEPVLAGVDQSRLVGREGARYLVGVARVHLAGGRSRPATQALDAALEADNNFLPAWIERAHVHLISGNAPAAVETLLRLSTQDLGLDAALSPLTQVWYSEPSQAEFETALEAAARPDARLTTQLDAALGVLQLVTGSGRARATLNRALTDDDSDVAAHAALAQSLLAAGEAGASLVHIKRVLASDTTLGFFHAMRGRALSLLGQKSEAEAAFGQGLVGARGSPTLQLWRARALASSGRTDDAAAALREALRLAPEHVEARRALVDLVGLGR